MAVKKGKYYKTLKQYMHYKIREAREKQIDKSYRGEGPTRYKIVSSTIGVFTGKKGGTECLKDGFKNTQEALDFAKDIYKKVYTNA